MYWNTVSPLLKQVLIDLMQEQLFAPFRLVGGTSLSLQIGHRVSVDIDLFTAADYGSIDFKEIRSFLENKYPYCSSRNLDNVAFGTYFEVGNSKKDFVKIDLYYTDEFIFDLVSKDDIRMASENEIIAMKLDVVLRGGRKKDFWDLHYYLDKVSIDEMISFYEKRYPYTDCSAIKSQFVNFELADPDFDPMCLLNKSWELIKLDFHQNISGNS
ncbi:nucleotidyltransferase AbiEii toxin of type IV toxin-antitoxin system [Flavobacterium limicola]|uniref:Nucleotidyltransferase AbiEii toxin of type IV toxin-antitoxin system n=1 Tax=Flavobacterium limicola TaxID=180441 RepID=A0A495S1T9_9FLAO|nr:nucleotidyl transferase AbiEii/AbiGii toxin family protein [Flavobacterium limicola]RKS93767.1 nucleotidyltransferase AbiEii toxin of type IV toxin-antitoxin system [Flavobacterium limicola]